MISVTGERRRCLPVLVAFLAAFPSLVFDRGGATAYELFIKESSPATRAAKRSTRMRPTLSKHNHLDTEHESVSINLGANRTTERERIRAQSKRLAARAQERNHSNLPAYMKHHMDHPGNSHKGSPGKTGTDVKGGHDDLVTPPQPFEALARHRFIFVGGLPQSGTSLVRQQLLLRQSASGQDSCKRSTKCALSNVEGQWLLENDKLHLGKLRSLYGPGKESHFLTEANYTVAGFSDRGRKKHRGEEVGVVGGGRGEEGPGREELRRWLWAGWSRYWDSDQPFLVEKSPTNLVKVRWLAGLFSGGEGGGAASNGTSFAPEQQLQQLLQWPRHRFFVPPAAGSPSFPRFLLVVRDPTSNAHFADPRHCADYAKTCDPDHSPQEYGYNSSGSLLLPVPLPRPLRGGGRGGGGGGGEKEEEERVREERCAVSHAACASHPYNKLRARIEYVRHWVAVHERVVADLTAGWPSPSSPSSSTSTSPSSSSSSSHLVGEGSGPKTRRRKADQKEDGAKERRGDSAEEARVDGGSRGDSGSGGHPTHKRAKKKRKQQDQESETESEMPELEPELELESEGKSVEGVEVNREDRGKERRKHGQQKQRQQRRKLRTAAEKPAASSSASAPRFESVKHVRVVRYEQVSTPCVCHQMVAFAFSAPSDAASASSKSGDGEASGGSSDRLLVSRKEVEEACSKAPACNRGPWASAAADSSMSTSHLPASPIAGWLKATEKRKYQNEHKKKKEQEEEKKIIRRGRRRLRYEGRTSGGSAVVARDVNSIMRHTDWRSFLKSGTFKRFADSQPPLFSAAAAASQPSTAAATAAGGGGGGGGGGGAQQQKAVTVREALKKLEPRLRRFGYSVLEPGKPRYSAAGDRASDVFAPWAVVVPAT